MMVGMDTLIASNMLVIRRTTTITTTAVNDDDARTESLLGLQDTQSQGPLAS